MTDNERQTTFQLIDVKTREIIPMGSERKTIRRDDTGFLQGDPERKEVVTVLRFDPPNDKDKKGRVYFDGGTFGRDLSGERSATPFYIDAEIIEAPSNVIPGRFTKTDDAQ